METIEIGAVLVRATTLAVEAESQTFVRPVRHPVLTPFCTELTGITQAMLADAPAFPEAMEALRRTMLAGRWGVVWGSWASSTTRSCDGTAPSTRTSTRCPST